MDRSGIAAAILSRPGIPVSELEKARKLAREGNEFAAQVVRDHPDRFGLFATLPLFDVEGSVRETAYGFEVLKADGVCFATSYGNRWPGDPAFAPVLVVPTGETVGHLPGLHLDGKVLRGIERDNALTLFPRFKA